MIGMNLCKYCGDPEEFHDYETLSRYCYPRRIELLEAELKEATEEADYFDAGCQDGHELIQWHMPDGVFDCPLCSAIVVRDAYEKQIDEMIESMKTLEAKLEEAEKWPFRDSGAWVRADDMRELEAKLEAAGAERDSFKKGCDDRDGFFMDMLAQRDAALAKAAALAEALELIANPSIPRGNWGCDDDATIAREALKEYREATTEPGGYKKYFNEWRMIEDLHRDFMPYGDFEKGLRIEGFPTDDEIIFASYESGNYEGDSLVLFWRGGKLYLNEASHCSCYGLEKGWSPLEVEPEQVLRQRIYGDHRDDALAAWRAIGEVLNGAQ